MENKDKPELEEWLPVVGFEGYYEVSNYGSVRSVKRTISYPSGRIQVYKSILRKLTVNHYNGYVYVGLTNKEHKQSQHRVHRLVARAFIPNPDNLPEVNHEDFDKQNNAVSNLKWCDKFYQNQHAAKKEGRQWQNHRKGMVGCLNPASKPVVATGLDGHPIGYYESGILAAKALGVNQAKVSACCRGKRKHTKGIKFEFS